MRKEEKSYLDQLCQYLGWGFLLSFPWYITTKDRVDHSILHNNRSIYHISPQLFYLPYFTTIVPFSNFHHNYKLWKIKFIHDIIYIRLMFRLLFRIDLELVTVQVHNPHLTVPTSQSPPHSLHLTVLTSQSPPHSLHLTGFR